MKKVLILFGGNSTEHNISIKSVINIIDNIDTSIFKYQLVGITKDNKFIKCSRKNIINKSWYSKKHINNIIKYLSKFDLIFPILHGKNGEDGKLQGMLDLFNIKYVGCKNISSVIGMEKELSKIYFNSIGIPQIPYIKYNNNLDDIIKLGFPLIIKPCNGGSSIGISKANTKDELIKGINLAKKYDNNIIIEKFITARELECACFEDDKLIVTNPGEIIYNHDFYDYDDKYKNKVDLIIPAKIDNKIIDKIKFYSEYAFNKLGCKDMCRMDYLYDEINNKLYLNEINTIPGFTDISMYPLLLKDYGYSYKDIITILCKKST